MGEKIYKIVRRKFSPLNPTTDIETTGSGLLQLYNSDNHSFEPNRLLTPTVIYPRVSVHDYDNLFPNGLANAALANVKWYANGVEIVSGADYSIDTSATDTAGTLTVYKNVPQEAPVHLTFKAILIDTRMRRNIDIVANTMLVTTVIEDGKYTIEVDIPREVAYDPTCDANTISITPQVWKGKDSVNLAGTGLTTKLCRINGTSLVDLRASDLELLTAATASVVQLDLRYIQKRDYAMLLLDGASEVARCQFSIIRSYPKYKAQLRQYGSLLPTQPLIRATAVITTSRGVLANPDACFDIIWHTVNTRQGDLQWNEGAEAYIDAYQAGLDSESDGIYCEINERNALDVVTDESGVAYTDENNIVYSN